jgi:hypothetical protein
VDVLRHYKYDLAITLVIGTLVGLFMGWIDVFQFSVLVVLEISLSFDNALVNAKVLERMSPFWQKMFLTVGLLIAVGFMRFLFPIIIVSVSARLGFSEVVSLAFNNPLVYAEHLEASKVVIATFGGVYLLNIFMDFIFNDRDVYWLRWLEVPLAKIGKLDAVQYLLSTAFILVAAQTFGEDHQVSVLIAGGTSLALYMAVTMLANLFEDEDDEEASTGKTVVRTGIGAFSLFMYLEVQDSAFSFDGVTGAFAISNDVIIIAAGLGIGALFVRSMTVHLVKTGTIGQYRYLEHGAYWAIGSLATCLLLEIADINIPEYITGLLGVLFIGASLLMSVRANRRDAVEENELSVDDAPVGV